MLLKKSLYCAVLENRVHVLAICRNSSSLEVFYILANSQCFTGQAELLLDDFEWRNKTCRVVRAKEISSVESCEVLQGTKKLVAADLCS